MSFFLVVRRYAPFSTFGGGFEGDKRTAGSVMAMAPARTVGIVVFDQLGCEGYFGYSSGSTFEAAGQWVSKVIGRHYSQVKAEISDCATQLRNITFTVRTAGANPLLPIIAPNIETFVDFNASFTSNEVIASGKVRGDSFPNAEVIILDAQLQGALLFDYRTSGGRETGPLTLFGRHSEQVLGEFRRSVKLTGSVFRYAISVLCRHAAIR